MNPTVIHHTFVLQRSFPVPPAQVFAAFSDPVKKRSWLVGAGKGDDQYELDFRVGGTERMMSRLGPQTPFPGTPLTSEGIHLDIVPNKRVVIAASMAVGDHRISAALTTFDLTPTESGTHLTFTHQAAFFENSDGPVMREAGWQKLLNSLEASLQASIQQ